MNGGFPLKNTIQRAKIIEYLKSVKTHPKAEEVYTALRKDIPGISLATVYRNLNLLTDHGDIIKLELNGKSHFDGQACNHVHCICTRCGKIIDEMREDVVKQALLKVKSNDFTPSCATVIIKGYCKKCNNTN
jgi:Fe2+ or Zn2+ uptake regulation protein